MAAEEPAGLARFAEKVAATARVAASYPARCRVARTWNEKRFPPAPTLVVIETTTAPAPEAWLAMTLDDKMPSAEGRETARRALDPSSQLEPAFFVDRCSCTDPVRCRELQRDLGFTRPVAASRLRAALTVPMSPTARGDRPSPAVSLPTDARRTATSESHAGWPGFERQPAGEHLGTPPRRALTATDGQTLGYPWMGVVETVHEQPFVALDGAVWEAGDGPQVPVRRATSRPDALDRASRRPPMMPRLRALERSGGVGRPAQAPSRPPHPVTPDAVRGHGIDIRGVLWPGGTGLVWAAMAPAGMLPGNPCNTVLRVAPRKPRCFR